ncbi:unnamed protein product [Adineta ricciae]|uniref:Transmembrane protein n=1 Tax=Adineta ricciae TaxID=249248 RepID=A0A814ESI3_ADIRI|nr:unnamed protein product [Adineta ricciae]
MHQRRSQSDTKSTGSISGSLSSMPTTSNPSSKTNTGRVSIYTMRERVIQNKMTRMIGKLAPNTETEVTSRLHQEVPAIRLDGHLTYCVYITAQNLVHLTAIYILLYHAVFWLDSNVTGRQKPISSRLIDQTKFEQTHVIITANYFHLHTGLSINIDLIDTYVYISLIGVSLVELISTFLWTFRKKLPCLIVRHTKLRHRVSRILVGMICLPYISFIYWLGYHTFVTHHLKTSFSSFILAHFILLTLFDKPNLFRKRPDNPPDQSTPNRKHHRNSTSSSSTSSAPTPALGRPSFRSSTSTQPRRITPVINTSPSVVHPWSRWSSVTEIKLEIHECSTFYAQARQEADDLWPLVRRRIILTFYRTVTSFILFDCIPILTLNPHIRSIESQPLKFLIFILTLSTFISHSAFLFPVKLQTTLQRIATHLGQWRAQANVRAETINEWSSECDSYTRGSVVKLSSTSQHFIAIQHLSNAAHPQSNAHAMLYRLFSDPTYFLTTQLVLCLVLSVFQVVWLFLGKSWEKIIISWFIIFCSSYPIFKITRDRFIMDYVEEHEYVQTTTTTSRQKKSS